MKNSVFRCYSFCVLALTFSTLSTPAFHAADQVKRREVDQKEIGRLRDHLHEAHRELAVQKGKIGRLERELEKAKQQLTKANQDANRKSVIPTQEVKHPKREEKLAVKADSASIVKTSEPKKSAPKTAVVIPVKREMIPVSTAIQSFHIAYDQNSAVNYEARQKALAWALEQIKKQKTVRFSITASANDSKYPEANLEIAENRARFLKAFLVQGGVPAAAIASAGAGADKGKIDPKDTGRSALISMLAPQKQAPQVKPTGNLGK